MSKISSPTHNHAPLPTGLLLLAPILAIVVYFSALNGALIHDGARLTAMNPQVSDAQGWSQVWLATTPPSPLGGAVYQPVLASLLRIQWTLWGGSPSSFHSVNLLLWAGVIVLYMLFLSRLVANPLARAIGVVLLVLHPMASQSIYGVAGQGALLSLLACLVALWLVQIARLGRLAPSRLAILLTPCCLIAYGADEMGLLLPLWLLALWLLDRQPATPDATDISITTAGQQRAKKHRKYRAVTSDHLPAQLHPAYVVIPILAMLAFYLILRYTAMNGLMPSSTLLANGWPETMGSRVSGGFSVFALAVIRLLWPVQPTSVYSPDYDLALPGVWLGALLLIVVAALTLMAIRRWKVIALGLVMTLLPLLAISQWLPLSRFFSEGPLLFALPGLSLLVAALIERATPGEIMPPVHWQGRVIALVALVAITAMAWQTRIRGGDWTATETFWQNEADRHPDNPYPLIRLMEEAIRKNQPSAVKTLADKAMPLSHPPQVDRILQLQAVFYRTQNSISALTDLLDKILASDRVYPVGYARSLAAVAQTADLTDTEEALWRRELQVNLEDFDAYYRLAEISFDKDDKAEAIRMSEKAVQNAPKRLKARAMALYGKMLIEGGYIKEGAQQLQIAMRNDPTMYEPYIYLIRLKWGNKDYEGAERLITQCNLHANVSSFVDLAILYSNMLDEQGKTPKTLELMSRWIQLYPNDVQLHLFVARYLVEHQFYEPAKKIYLRLMPNLKGAQLSETWTGLARVAKLGEGNNRIAIECLQKALIENPNNEEAQSLLRRFQAGSRSMSPSNASEDGQSASPESSIPSEQTPGIQNNLLGNAAMPAPQQPAQPSTLPVDPLTSVTQGLIPQPAGVN